MGVASHVPFLAQNGPAQLGGVISLPIRFALFLHRSCSRYAVRHTESAHSNWMMIMIMLIIIIIMYIYHALIDALSAHVVHINLNMIFYTHVEKRNLQ